MRYTQYRGLSQVRKWVRLKFAAMNLKKFWKDYRWNALPFLCRSFPVSSILFLCFFICINLSHTFNTKQGLFDRLK